MVPDAASSLRLSPGLRVVRRGRDQLQVGLYAGRRVVVPRSPVVERALHDLSHGRPLGDAPDPEVASVLARLDEAGCLGHARRAPAGRVAVLGALPGVDPRALLALAGIDLVACVDDADVALVLSVGELDRDDLDLMIRRGTTHLVVRLVDGGAVLGPFVVPGMTACLRCIDAHLSIADPDHAAVTARYARATARPRPDGVADLADPVLAVLASAWAVRDIAAHLRDQEPSTWSRTHLWGAGTAHIGTQRWNRHPECGCCWLPVT